MTRKLEDIALYMNRMVLVRKGIVEIKGVQPLDSIRPPGFWDGTIVSAKEKVTEGVLVDHVLGVRLSFGTSRNDMVINVSFLDERWKLRYPGKNEA